MMDKADTSSYKVSEYSLTYFIRGSITVQMSLFTSLDQDDLALLKSKIFICFVEGAP